MGVEIGHRYIAGVKKQTNPWGGVPMLCGAGDGFEFNSLTPKRGLALAENMGLFGNAYQRKDSVGELKPEPEIDFDLYYEDAAWALLGQFFSDSVSGSGPYTHDLTLLDQTSGRINTLAAQGDEGIDEFGSVKVQSLKLAISQDKKRGNCVAGLQAFDHDLNRQTADVAFVVASVALSGPPQTLTIKAAALAKFAPAPLTVTKAAGTTAINMTITYIDKFGITRQVTITETDFVSNLYTLVDSNGRPAYARQVPTGGIVVNTFTGAGNVSVGVSAGINNATTKSAITFAAVRDAITFPTLKVYLNRQEDPDFTAADEYPLTGIELDVEAQNDSTITSIDGIRIDEPAHGGGGFPNVQVRLSTARFTDKQVNRFYDLASGDPLKWKAVATGMVVSNNVRASLTMFGNSLQLAEGDKNVSGPGIIPFDIAGRCSSVLTPATGMPGGHIKPVMLRLINGRSAVVF